ncbi:MAG: bifunctional phosphopantothenoylcysteine decarboxylase/phosphopantothenate--cysteine ligase CoaBC, partial [Candidatus Nanopelagicales bacterium]
LGVSGGIAAYKACTLLRILRESGHDVRVVPTASALRFVGAPTWEARSGHSVSDSVWDDVPAVPHVSLGRWADAVIIAPASANVLARAAAGMSDDLLTATLLTATCPILMAPAMHTEMWEHPATRANVATLRGRGVQIIEPAVGRLTGADTGPGRLPEPEDLARALEAALESSPRDLAGRRLLVSVGGTREPLDPVRFLGNHSSGRQGFAIVERALARGAQVTAVVGAVDVPAPAGARVLPVVTAAQMREAMLAEQASADAVVMAAAVADFRPDRVAESKIKKSDDVAPEPVNLVRNPDILVDLVASRRQPQVIVGFAAETATDDSQLLSLARAKLTRKGCDLLVVNDVGDDRVFGRDETRVQVLAADGGVRADVRGRKAAAADAVLDEIVKILPA